MNKTFSILAILLVFIHIMMTVLYLSPPNPLTNSYQKIVSQYMGPLFRQNWRLFSPEPSIESLKMWYQCQSTDGNWNQWKDPTSKLIAQHYQNRISYYGKLHYVYQGLYRNLNNRYIDLIKKDAKTASQKIHDTSEFKVITTMIKKLCQKEGSDSRKKINFKIVRLASKNYSKRNDPRAKRNMRSIDFIIPPYDDKKGIL